MARDVGGNAAGEKIKHFVFIELAGSGAVTALHVVGEDLETGHGVRLGLVAQEKVAHFLVGIGEMRLRLDPNESAESRACAIVQRVFEKQVAVSVRRSVILQSSRVEFLRPSSPTEIGEHVAAAVLAGEAAQAFEPGKFCAEIEIKIQRGSIARRRWWR